MWKSQTGRRVTVMCLESSPLSKCSISLWVSGHLRVRALTGPSEPMLAWLDLVICSEHVLNYQIGKNEKNTLMEDQHSVCYWCKCKLETSEQMLWALVLKNRNMITSCYTHLYLNFFFNENCHKSIQNHVSEPITNNPELYYLPMIQTMQTLKGASIAISMWKKSLIGGYGFPNVAWASSIPCMYREVLPHCCVFSC